MYACSNLSLGQARSAGGAEAAGVLAEFLAHRESIPEHYWSARPAAGDGHLLVRGAVLVRALGRTEPRAASSPELLAALQQPPTGPGRELLRLLRADRIFTPAVVAAALALASGAVIVEAILFRGLFDAGSLAACRRIGALGGDSDILDRAVTPRNPLAASSLRFGRRLEIRLRLAFLSKIPVLGDRYFQSRLKSGRAQSRHPLDPPPSGARWPVAALRVRNRFYHGGDHLAGPG